MARTRPRPHDVVERAPLQYSAPSALRAGITCRCPRCGRGRLFAGFLKLAARCAVCDLDFGFADPADGPAFFVMSGVGIVVMMLWASWAVLARPPIWLQLVVVIGATTIGCLSLLRPMKAWLVAEQYVRKAGDGHWESLGAHGEGGFATDRRAASEGRHNHSA
jgi:uncharacterized protein (DUF983 family)